MPIKNLNKGLPMSTNLRVTKTKILICIVLLLVIMFLFLGKYIFVGNNPLSVFLNNGTYMYLGLMIVFFIAWVVDMKM
jgi:hypothetical protein